MSNGGGLAKLKQEYLNEDHKRKVNLEYVSKNDKCSNELQDEGLEPVKKKLKGQNKHRPREARVPKAEKLCLKLLGDNGCSYGDTCCFSHDLETFAKKRPKDISDHCFLYDTLGRCSYSFTCRFGGVHLTDDHKNKINEPLWEETKNKVFTTNSLTKELQVTLRKRNYDFKPSNLILDLIKTNCHKSDDNKQSSEIVSDNNELKLGLVADEDLIKLTPREKKKVDFNWKLYLAPLTTVGNLPYRRICKEYGAEITCGEMAMCSNLLQGQQSEWALLKRHHTEDVFGVQICGAHPDIMTRCAQLLSETIEIDFLDINMGCPIDLVFQKGSGCGLMGRAKKFEDIIHGMSSVLDVPLTVKMRTGIHAHKNTADTIIERIKNWGCKVAMISLHGRSREQRYTKEADWKYINECAKAAKPIPLYGCGDILSFEEVMKYKETSDVSGVMIARGALIKPWIFTEIQEQRHWDISSAERLDMIKKYVNYGLEHWGSDSEGVEKTRRFLLEWLSFLYRYIPVGLLECPPQKINERPLPYHGRDEMETLMASPSCSDWVKISEMILGPVPDDFSFLPKHKANAYQ